MHPELASLFDTHVASSLDKQLYLEELITAETWELDVPGGTINFGPEHHWKCQVLGTTSDVSQTWLWSWANAGNYPVQLQQAANALKRFGSSHSIPILTQPEMPLAEVPGDTLLYIAAGMCHAKAPFKAVYEGGAVYLLIVDPDYPPHIVDPIEQLPATFRKAAERFHFNHRKALVSFARQYGLQVAENGGAVVLAEASGPVLRAVFDAENHVSAIEPVVQH